jgi:hypothetical protein
MKRKNTRANTSNIIGDRSHWLKNGRGSRISGRRAFLLGVVLIILGLCCYNQFNSYSLSAPAPQANPTRRDRLQGRLSLQPEADRFRRKLGERFLKPGRELTVITGTLTVSGVQRQANSSQPG